MKPPKIQFIAITSAFILLTGCVTNGSQSTWIKASGDAAGNIEQERAMAQGDCLARAYESFTANPMPSNNCIGNCFGNTGGLTSGFLAGAAARQNRETREARELFYDSCMMGKGWQRQEM